SAAEAELGAGVVDGHDAPAADDHAGNQSGCLRKRVQSDGGRKLGDQSRRKGKAARTNLQQHVGIAGGGFGGVHALAAPSNSRREAEARAELSSKRNSAGERNPEG